MKPRFWPLLLAILLIVQSISQSVALAHMPGHGAEQLMMNARAAEPIAVPSHSEHPQHALPGCHDFAMRAQPVKPTQALADDADKDELPCPCCDDDCSMARCSPMVWLAVLAMTLPAQMCGHTSAIDAGCDIASVWHKPPTPPPNSFQI
jgi:hypothetical protein